jgi:predicted nuclease of restriction endonuclease-like (RecB) superfamily
MTETYWQIGHDIVEFEQGGKIRADYGKALLNNLSRDLKLLHGKGFSRSNLSRFRQFYLAYPKCAKASHILSWSHYIELLKLDDPLERSFYEQQAIRERWSVPELQRQKKSSLFLRLAAGKDKDAILQLAHQGQVIEQPSDLLRDPFVFEFLKIPEPQTISETELETRLCDHLQPFLLELGKGFTFVGRQYRITLNNTHYYLQRMKTKWGSCNHRAGNVRLNTELVKKPKDLLEYVVVHEMVHLLEPTHSERFQTILQKHYPTWREARAELNELPLAAEKWK